MDIREQFPLPLSKTLPIAERLGVKHHMNGARPITPTTDFLFTLRDGTLLARSVKPSSELSSKRVWEKFDIERTYWEEEGVDCGMVVEKDICRPLARNLLWLHKNRCLDGYDISEADAVQIGKHLLPLVLEGTTPLNRLALEADERLGYPAGTCLLVAKYLIVNRCWPVDLTTLINPSDVLTLSPFNPWTPLHGICKPAALQHSSISSAQ